MTTRELQTLVKAIAKECDAGEGSDEYYNAWLRGYKAGANRVNYELANRVYFKLNERARSKKTVSKCKRKHH